MTALPEVQFKAVGRSDIRRRVEAYRLLFSVEPRLRVSGTLRATDGDLVFIKGRPELVTKVGVNFEIQLEGETVVFKFPGNAGAATFYLSGQ